MMKLIRSLLALCLALALVLSASVASAASKTFTKVPTLKLTFSTAINSYSNKDLTVTAGMPGFLTLKLLTEDGAEVYTIAENKEILSGSNVFDFYARDLDGNPLDEGKYEFSATMVSQFGVSSKEATRSFTIKEISEEDAEILADLRAAGKENTSSGAKVFAGNVEGSKTSSSKTSSSKTSSVAVSTGEAVTYSEGSFVMGDDGLQIGVGVSDAAMQTNSGYWSLTSDASDEQIWAALVRPMVAADVDEQESAYIYNTPEENRKKLGTVSGFSQGLNLILEREDGWSLVEAFRNEDGAFVRGYIRSNKLRTVEPDQTYGMVIDKAAQTLTVYKEGQRVGSVKVCTGLATAEYPHRETPAGEYVTATRRGTIEYYGMGYSKYTIRLNNTYYLSEIPTTKKNGTDFSLLENLLGQKVTRGNICIAHAASSDGGINAEWIWDMTTDRKRVKVLILDDKERSSVPVSK